MKETTTLIQREIDLEVNEYNDDPLSTADIEIEQMFADQWELVYETVLFEDGDTMVRVMRFERETQTYKPKDMEEIPF